MAKNPNNPSVFQASPMKKMGGSTTIPKPDTKKIKRMNTSVMELRKGGSKK